MTTTTTDEIKSEQKCSIIGCLGDRLSAQHFYCEKHENERYKFFLICSEDHCVNEVPFFETMCEEHGGSTYKNGMSDKFKNVVKKQDESLFDMALDSARMLAVNSLINGLQNIIKKLLKESPLGENTATFLSGILESSIGGLVFKFLISTGLTYLPDNIKDFVKLDFDRLSHDIKKMALTEAGMQLITDFLPMLSVAMEQLQETELPVEEFSLTNELPVKVEQEQYVGV